MIKGKYKRIVAYGCSFTAGDELGDAEGLGLPEETVDSLKRSGVPRRELYGNGTIESNCGKIGRKLSWVRWLSEKYGVDYSNRGHPGGSLPQMVYRIERDYRTGMIQDDDLVLVGLTSMYRWFQFDGSGKELSWVFGHPIKDVSEYNKVLIQKYVNPYNIYWNYHLYLNYLNMLCERKKNLKLFHGMTAFSKERHFFDIENNTKLEESFSKTIESFKFDGLLNAKYGMADIYSHLPLEEATHGWNHPKVKYHKEFANLLYAWIEEKVT